MNNRYTITEAANILGVHAHTLRYWEEELHLDIPRNEMGHRMYESKQIEIFQMVKNLKEKGYQLNAIRMQVMAGIENHNEIETSVNHVDKNAALKQEKMQQFQQLMTELVKNAIIENKEVISKELSVPMIKEMNYLVRELDDQQEQRYRKLDETIRECLTKKRIKKSNWGQKDVAQKLKEELKNNKKRAVTQCSDVTT